MYGFTRTVRAIGPAMSAALVMVMFPVSSSIWKMFPSFPGGGGKDENVELAVNPDAPPSLPQPLLTSQYPVTDLLTPVLVPVSGEQRPRLQHQSSILQVSEGKMSSVGPGQL